MRAGSAPLTSPPAPSPTKGGEICVIILMGLQGSGKTTFFQQRFGADYAHISMDLLRNNPRPARRQLHLLREALAAGRNVVVDNTNATAADRAPLIALGHEYGARVVGYYFEPDVRGSLARNRQREGKARVPDVAIFATKKRLQPPSRAEGFDDLYTVRVGPGGEFTVQSLIKSETGDGQSSSV
jgi:predicted kinase